MNGQNIESGWIFSKYESDPLAAEFVAYLIENSEFGPDEAIGGAVWHDPIPNRSEWEKDIKSHNKAFRYAQRIEADQWADHCESTGPELR